MSLAIAQRTGLMYEGRGGIYLPLIPTPMLSHARIVDVGRPTPSSVPALARFEGQRGLIFREDQFDPVTRTRRGRLYEGGKYSQPTTDFYVLPHPHEIPTGQPSNLAGARAELFVYVPPSELISNASKLTDAVVGLGTSAFETQWRVVGAEMVGYGDLLLTLRSRSPLGVLPELVDSAIPPVASAAVKASVDDVISAALRESPGSVVDKCRHALVIIISSWLVSQGSNSDVMEKDLGDLCKILWRTGRRTLAGAAWIVARLHNKTKPNARIEHGLGAALTEDADYCIQAVGLILRELRWSKESPIA